MNGIKCRSLNLIFSEMAIFFSLMLCVLRDMAELLKTPGRLRGKTPGTTRKRPPPIPVQGREVCVSNSARLLEACG